MITMTKPRPTPTTVGRRLRQARVDMGLTQAELARRAGVDASSVSKVESGQTYAPSGEYLGQLAAILGVSVDTLMHGQPAPSDQDRSELRHLVATTLGPSNAEMIETVVNLLAEKPTRDRDVVLRVVIDLIKTFPPLP